MENQRKEYGDVTGDLKHKGSLIFIEVFSDKNKPQSMDVYQLGCVRQHGKSQGRVRVKTVREEQ